MRLHLTEDFNTGIFATVRNEDDSYLCDAKITSIETKKNPKRFDFYHITAKAEIDSKEVILEGNFYL